MNLIPVADNITTFAPPDRSRTNARLRQLRGAFNDAYEALRRHYQMQGAIADCPLFHAHCRLTSFYEGRIDKLERSLMNALASDGLTDEQRDRILRGLHGTKARDVNLLTAAETDHLTQYRALDQRDRSIVRALISRLSRDHGGETPAQ